MRSHLKICQQTGVQDSQDYPFIYKAIIMLVIGHMRASNEGVVVKSAPPLEPQVLPCRLEFRNSGNL
jgi:hypothetical protein